MNVFTNGNVSLFLSLIYECVFFGLSVYIFEPKFMQFAVDHFGPFVFTTLLSLCGVLVR